MSFFGSFDESGEEPDVFDEYESNAEVRILETISQHEVVADRELKVRLEREFFPWVVGRVVGSLLKSGKVRLVHPPGRNGRMGTPDNFYMDPSVDYDNILHLLLRKRRVSAYINAQLTRFSPAGFHAEDVFEDAFSSLKFKIVGTEVSTFGDKTVTGTPGKELPDLDFVIEKDKLTYGVDVKNWIKYEFDSITEVLSKVSLASQLGIIPFICARYVDKDTLYKITEMPGIVYPYQTLLLPPEFRTLAEEATTLLGYPILAANLLPQYKLDFVNKLHDVMLKRLRR